MKQKSVRFKDRVGAGLVFWRGFFNFLGWVMFFVGLVFVVFGFGEDGFRILRESAFWSFVGAVWVFSLLCFFISERFS